MCATKPDCTVARRKERIRRRIRESKSFVDCIWHLRHALECPVADMPARIDIPSRHVLEATAAAVAAGQTDLRSDRFVTYCSTQGSFFGREPVLVSLKSLLDEPFTRLNTEELAETFRRFGARFSSLFSVSISGFFSFRNFLFFLF